MTDRYNFLVVVLEENIRDDDAETILNAIRMVKGVLSVEGNVRMELGNKLLEVLYPKRGET